MWIEASVINLKLIITPAAFRICSVSSYKSVTGTILPASLSNFALISADRNSEYTLYIQLNRMSPKD
jgi:hypothetical protein